MSQYQQSYQQEPQPYPSFQAPQNEQHYYQKQVSCNSFSNLNTTSHHMNSMMTCDDIDNYSQQDSLDNLARQYNKKVCLESPLCSPGMDSASIQYLNQQTLCVEEEEDEDIFEDHMIQQRKKEQEFYFNFCQNQNQQPVFRDQNQNIVSPIAPGQQQSHVVENFTNNFLDNQEELFPQQEVQKKEFVKGNLSLSVNEYEFQQVQDFPAFENDNFQQYSPNVVQINQQQQQKVLKQNYQMFQIKEEDRESTNESEAKKKKKVQKEKPKRINTSHVPLNMLNSLYQHLVKIYQQMPCKCGNDLSVLTQNNNQNLSDNFEVSASECKKCYDLSILMKIKKNPRKNIETFRNLWSGSARLQKLSENFLLHFAQTRFLSNTLYRSSQSADALYRCLPTFLQGSRNYQRFYKLQQ